MPFQIKDFASITASILNHARATTKKVTDWIPGSVARTLVEAPAVEVEELYLQMFSGLRDAIPVATFKSFGFDRLPPMYARGFVSISIETAPSEDFEIVTGTVFTTEDGRNYLSTETVTWGAGETAVRVPVAGAAAGLEYNVAAGGINGSPAFSDDYTISNALIENGRDDETDAEREARFAEFVSALSRGTVPACLAAARSAVVLDVDGNIYERVVRIGINELPGYVRIYIYSSRGVASAQLLVNGQRIIDGWRDVVTGQITPGYRSGGVRVDILAMAERQVPFTVAVEMLPGATLTESLKQQMADTFSTLLAGVETEDILYVGNVVDELLNTPGVKKIVPESNENIVCGAHETLVAGLFTATAL